MPERRDPADMKIAIAVLRALRGWDQSGLAKAAGVSPSSISRYENGDTVPTRRTFERIVAAVGIPVPMVNRLFSWIRSARAAVAGSPADAEGVIDALCGEISEGVSRAFRSAAVLVLAGQPAIGAGPWRRVLPPAEADREQAAMLWKVMKRRDTFGRRMQVEDAQEFRNWALAELVCSESIKAAADDAGRAGELAELAVLIAELAPGEEPWRRRLQGYAAAHLGNARRVRTDWSGAEEAFRRAGQLWESGAPGDPGLLSEAQVLSLEASLRTDQDRLAEAAALLDRALAASPGEALRPNLLIQRARVLEWGGDYEGALAALRQVGPLPPERQEPRLLWMLRFHPACNLAHLARFAEAEALLPEVRALTAQLGNKLDTLRLRWLEGRVAAGVGRAAEAAAALSQVRDGFAAEDIAYDAALVTLELAVVYLEQERTREVKLLARQMAPIFKAQGVHQHALAALKLFCEAAEKETATVELARRIVAYLYRAQHQPELRFEAPER